jgi:hypothetical protein
MFRTPGGNWSNLPLFAGMRIAVLFGVRFHKPAASGIITGC